MRPITLRMAGLRSYRTERVIEFGAPGLIAIIGDTGAGKSSILEALTGALYGASTWDNRGIGALISDAAQTVQLELTFIVAGQAWTVSRSASRNNYPPSRHVLHCHDTGEKLIGERLVTGRVTGLLGLDCKQFLRVVVLPQNRFMELLDAARGERNTILKGIFRLDDLDLVRQAAEKLRDDLEPRLIRVRIARAKLADDPAAQLGGAQARRSAAEQDKARLAQVRGQVTDHQEKVRGVESTAGEVRTGLNQLTAARSQAGDVDEVLTAIAASAAGLDARALALAGQRDQLEEREAAAQQALDSAAAAGEDSTTLATAMQTLDALADTVPELITARCALVAQDRQLASQISEVKGLGVQLASRRRDLAEAAQALVPLQAEAGQAEQARDDARAGLTALKDALASVMRASDQSDQSRNELAATRADARHAAATFEQATLAAEEAEARLEEVRRQNSAAHAASHSQPGDPCPVCDRPLPETFAPPASANEAAAKTHASECRARATDAGHAASTMAEKARRATNDAADALEREAAQLIVLADATSAALRHAVAIQAVTALGSGEIAAVRAALTAEPVTSAPSAIRSAAGDLTEDPALDETDRPAPARSAAITLISTVGDIVAVGLDQLIEPLTRHADELNARHQEARASADLINQSVAGLEAQVGEGEKALGREREQLLKRRRELTAAATRVAGQLAALPPLAADVARSAALTDVPLADLTPALDLQGETGPAGADDDTAIALPGGHDEEFAASFRIATIRVSELLKETRAKLDAHQLDLRRARQDLSSLTGSENQLAGERARDVIRPIRLTAAALQTIQTRAVDLHGRLAGAVTEAGSDTATTSAAAMEVPQLPESEDAMTTPQVTAYRLAAGAFLGAAEALAGSAGEVLASLDMSAAAERQAITEVLAGHDIADLADLQQAEIDAATRWEVADRDARRFRSEQPVAARLDAGIADVSKAVAVLRSVARALTSAQFIDFVIARRSTALLLIASKLLGQLTGDGYGFTGDFQIIDRRTRTERHVKTLSGGETFLASLALALSLVELAGRSGGRIDSLFLDEGFGSLDTAILAEALDVLRGHVSTGRLVAVISHIHAVAADIDRVMLVTKNPGGSDLRWLEPTEREQLLFDDVSAGLLN
jgi:DNA repair protein SbcC/Rad50